MADAPTFGLSWLSDGATISRMPLINTLAMCSNIPPTCAAIHDCSDHIAEGGKKDASFIALLMVESVLKYDPSRMYSDIFFFDGASNVAKAGKVLEAKFPRAYALHGGEHVVSLFFHDLSKQPAVRVSNFFSALISHCFLTNFLIPFMRLLLVNAAGFIMFLGQELVTGSMCNLWHSHPFITRAEG